MRKRNNGDDGDKVLRNQFTAYLDTAIRRRKIQYLQKKMRLYSNELSMDPLVLDRSIAVDADLMAGLPVIEQVEDLRLQQALLRNNQRDLFILITRILENRSLAEIADELGLGYNTVASVFNRIKQRIKKEMEGDE